MRKIPTKYWWLAVFIMAGLLIGWWQFLPDGRLHIYFCDVGQGDAIYIRLPDGNDALIDGGPGKKILTCLGKHMPFYDRTIDIVFLTHPQKDHYTGLIDVIKRYNVRYFVSSSVVGSETEYQQLRQIINNKHIVIKSITTGDEIKLGDVTLIALWPDASWLKSISTDRSDLIENMDVNLFSLYLYLKFGKFDMLLTGDGDWQVQQEMINLGLFNLLPQKLEVLKVPHHGSKTALSSQALDWLEPKVSVISVGKNSFGHPNKTLIKELTKWGKVLRTDEKSDIEIIVSKKGWWIK